MGTGYSDEDLSTVVSKECGGEEEFDKWISNPKNNYFGYKTNFAVATNFDGLNRWYDKYMRSMDKDKFLPATFRTQLNIDYKDLNYKTYYNLDTKTIKAGFWWDGGMYSMAEWDFSNTQWDPTGEKAAENASESSQPETVENLEGDV